MSLKRLTRWLLLLLLAALSAAGYLLLRPNAAIVDTSGAAPAASAATTPTGPGKIDTQSRALMEKAEINRGSVLIVGGPAVDYALPASSHMVRLSTNASLESLEQARQQRRQDPMRRWKYVLEVEEFDALGRRLRLRTLHFQRDLTEVALPGGQRGSGVFYLSEQSPKPLSTASLKLDYAGDRQPGRLRVRLTEADPSITDVLLRIHTPEPVSPRNAQSVWQRLNETQQAQLASGNVFPPELLIEQERSNIIASRWRPLGPSGEAHGRDIYVLPTTELGAPADPIKPAALSAGPQRKALIQLPEGGARVRLVLEPFDSATGYPARVDVAWYGHSIFERAVSSHAWPSGQFELVARYGGGWLEIGASHEGLVRAYIEEQNGQREITPPMRYLRVYPAQTDAPVDFAISHVDAKPTPLRLVLRRMTATGDPLSSEPVQVSFLDAQGKVLRTSTLRPDWKVSMHDVPWPEAPGKGISEPVEAFFNVPAHVRRVRVESSRSVAVVGFTRPGDLPRAVRTPEDTVVPEAEKDAIPGWFILQPVEFENQILNGASRLLAIQTQAPENRPELSAGQFTFEEFHPLSGGAARVFFAPREPGVPDRPEAAGVTYRPLPADGRIHLLTEPGRIAITPRLAWVSDSGQLQRFAVTADSRPWVEGTGTAMVGETILPALAPGHHRVQVDASRKARWFLTHLGAGPAWVKRRALRFNGKLQFEVERTGSEEEFISVRLFRPASTAGRMKVKVWVDAPTPADPLAPMEGWLFTERIHDVRPSGQLALPLAETSGEKTDAGQPFYIPFPEGSPRGRYRITLTPEGGSGWVSVSRIIPARLAKPRLFVEEVKNER